MKNFKIGDTVVCVYYSFNNKTDFYYMEHAFDIYNDTIETYIYNGAKGLYGKNIFKIKMISKEYILLDSGVKVYEKDFDKIYTIEETEAYIKGEFAEISISYQKILNKSLEITQLMDDIINISNSYGINIISESNHSGAIGPIRDSIRHFGWNTSSLTC